MKKIISLVLALALVCGLAVNVVAANVGVSVDKNVIEAGDTVTVAVTLDEEIPAEVGTTSVQCVLTYDKAVLTYVSATAGEGYSWLTFTASNRKDEIKINSGSDFSVKTLPAGTVAILTFTANETTEASDLALSVTMVNGLSSGESVEVPGASASVVVCPGHNYIETKSEATCLEPATVTYVCEYCGDSYAGDSEGVYGEHSLSLVEATYTCTEDGVKEHYVCDVCGKYFAVGQWGMPGEEIAEADLFAPAAHTPWTSEEWMEEGYIVETVICGICEEVLSDPIVVYQLFSEDCPTTINVAAGATVNYNAYGFGGYKILIYGENVTVEATSYGMWGSAGNTATYVSENGVVTIPVDGMQARLVITNNSGSDAAYEVKVDIPEGDYANPKTLYDGENTVAIPENMYEYYTNYIPVCDGTLTVAVTGDYWNYTVNCYGTYTYGDNHSYQDDEPVNTETIEVKGGIPVEIILSNVTVGDEWTYPAGNINVKLDFVPTHNIVKVDAKAPSCFEEGNIEYWYCDICGAAWADEALTQVTNLMSVKVAPWCQDVVHIDAVAPGCHYEGNVEYWYCTNPEHGTVWTDADRTQVSNHLNVIVPELGGEVVHVEGKRANCYEEGNIEYWYCEECEQVWQDEALTQLTNIKNVVLPMTEHNIIHMERVEPGCHYEGHEEHWYCPNCEIVWIDAELKQISNHKNVVIPALGGDVVHVEAVAPSCFAEGNIEYWYCEECEQVWQNEALTQLTNFKNVILPATHNNIVHMEAVAPGCHYEGHVEHWYCTDCDTVWTDADMLQISNHLNVILPEVGGEVIHVEAAEPDCRNPGHIEYWYCEECEQVWQDEALTQLTNRKNVITEDALGFVDENKDGVCDICNGNNPHTGDVTIMVAVAAAVISATGIVALPIAKKKFF